MEELLQARLAAEFGEVLSYLSNGKVITELALAQTREREESNSLNSEELN